MVESVPTKEMAESMFTLEDRIVSCVWPFWTAFFVSDWSYLRSQLFHYNVLDRLNNSEII